MISIHPGKHLFDFFSEKDWINRGRDLFKQAGYSSQDTICIDAKGRMVNCGKHFRIAQEDGAYPIRVHVMREDEER